MPCSDVSEQIRVALDAEDRLVTFSLAKATCGAPVGGTLLGPWVEGKTVDDLLASDLPLLVPDVDQFNALEQFLLTKQFAALTRCLAGWTGHAAASKDDIFALTQLDHTADGTTVEGLVRVDVEPATVPACKSCCTTKRASRKQRRD